MARAQVVTSSPNGGATLIEVGMGETLVGRSPEAAVRFRSPSVSRHHAQFRWDGRRLAVRDLESAQGTFVNGEPISGWVEVGPGDDLRFGPEKVALFISEETDPEGIHIEQMRGGTVNDMAGNQFNTSVWGEGDLQAQAVALSTPGTGRRLLILGAIIAICGFAGWMTLIFSGGGADGRNPFEQTFLGLPAAPLAFGAFLGGALISGVGSMLALAQYRREQMRRQTP